MSDDEKRKIQLLQADRLAAVGVLAAGLAHEINNPLTYSLYNLEGLVEDLGQLETLLSAARSTTADIGQTAEGVRKHVERVPDLRERLEAALEGVLRVRDIVRDLETFSNVESDRLVPLELRTVIDSALRLGSAECRHRARVVTDYGNTPVILGSPARLAQVFLNLVINAAQAIAEGHRAENEIRVVLSAQGAEVVVEVRDTGEGIAPEHMEHLFDPFFTTRPIGIGSGLGLSVCHNVVEAHGGSIEVESTRGRGSCFRVRLPAAAGTATAPADEVVPAPAKQHALSVLVVDDEPEVGKAVCRMLDRKHQVTLVRSGAEAQQAIAEQDFDVIVCDLMMPELSGMDLHDYLCRSDPELARRIVFMTGGAFTERARRFVEQVDNVCLAKPFKPADLRRAVERLGRNDLLSN